MSEERSNAIDGIRWAKEQTEGLRDSITGHNDFEERLSQLREAERTLMAIPSIERMAKVALLRSLARDIAFDIDGGSVMKRLRWMISNYLSRQANEIETGRNPTGNLGLLTDLAEALSDAHQAGWQEAHDQGCPNGKYCSAHKPSRGEYGFE